MIVVRRGSAAVVVAVAAVAGAVVCGLEGTASAQEAATGTAVLEEPSGCAENPLICQSGAAPITAGGGAQLPRTGPDDRLLAVGAVGTALLLSGAGAVVAGRRRTT